VQYDTPDAILSKPVDDFVSNFVGVDRAIKRLSLFSVADAALALPSANAKSSVAASLNLRDALSLMVAGNTDILAVTGEDGVVVGHLTREAIFSI
jgi:osmoprotectant transport system ATP-binding protein